MGSLVIDGTAYTRVKGAVDRYVEAPGKSDHEDASDRIALAWGFSTERATFLSEDREGDR